MQPVIVQFLIEQANLCPLPYFYLVLYHLPKHCSTKKIEAKNVEKKKINKKKIKKHNFKIPRTHVYPQTTSKMAMKKVYVKS